MLNWTLSVLVVKDLLSYEEAERLSKELALKTYPTGFNDAHAIVKGILEDVNK